MMAIEDALISKKGMYPLWIFTDLHYGKHVGGPYVCFIGAHYPAAFVATHEDTHKRVCDMLKDGTWKLEALKEASDANAKIGWGSGKTPQEAFRKACYSSGYLKVTDATK